MVRHEKLHVARVVVLADRLQRLDLRQGLLVHLRHQHLLGILVVRRDARHHVRDDESPEVLRVLQRVLDGEDAAPRVA